MYIARVVTGRTAANDGHDGGNEHCHTASVGRMKMKTPSQRRLSSTDAQMAMVAKVTNTHLHHQSQLSCHLLGLSIDPSNSSGVWVGSRRPLFFLRCDRAYPFLWQTPQTTK